MSAIVVIIWVRTKQFHLVFLCLHTQYSLSHMFTAFYKSKTSDHKKDTYILFLLPLWQKTLISVGGGG